MELIYFVLASFGLTQILAYGTILDSIRPTKGKLGELFKCSMCLGFHSGWVMFLLFWNSGVFLFPNIIIGAAVMSFISSGTSYVLDKVVSDNGVEISIK